MKPSEHPEFFTRPAPDGASRESSIEIDAQGRFLHEGQLVTHPGLQRAFASWVQRHPIDGRFILCNGYDWTYFTVAETPFFVEGILLREDAPMLQLNDGTVEPLEPAGLGVDAAGALYAHVKKGQFEAKFSPAAQLQLAPWVVDAGERPALKLAGQFVFPALRA
jgi:uncharacterized protein